MAVVTSVTFGPLLRSVGVVLTDGVVSFLTIMNIFHADRVSTASSFEYSYTHHI